MRVVPPPGPSPASVFRRIHRERQSEAWKSLKRQSGLSAAFFGAASVASPNAVDGKTAFMIACVGLAALGTAAARSIPRHLNDYLQGRRFADVRPGPGS